MAMVKGFLVRNSAGAYLTGGYEWKLMANNSEAYLHLYQNIGEILKRGRAWSFPPVKVIPANYDSNRPLHERICEEEPEIRLCYLKGRKGNSKC